MADGQTRLVAVPSRSYVAHRGVARTWEGLRATAEALLASSPSINAVSWSTLSFGLSSPFGLGAKTSLEARLMGAKTGEASPASRPLHWSR